jgi:hypothetical protein
MAKTSTGNTITKFLFNVGKIVFFLAGGFLFYRSRKKLVSIIQNKNVILSVIYAILLAFITLFYRLFVLLNSLLQQAR